MFAYGGMKMSKSQVTHSHPLKWGAFRQRSLCYQT